MRPERITPGPGQESVWDYPRPPVIHPSSERVRVVHAGKTIADTCSALRVLETSQAPAFYLPRADVDMSLLRKSEGSTFCEWKGRASYFSILTAGRVTVPDAAWTYESPSEPFTPIQGHLAFYPQRVDECWVGDERVVANAGRFYGGWITSRVVGPFKGAEGTMGW